MSRGFSTHARWKWVETALPICLSISFSSDKLFHIVDPNFVNSFTTSNWCRWWWYSYLCWDICFVFFEIIVSPKSVHVLAQRSIKNWRWDGLCAATGHRLQTPCTFSECILDMSWLSSERGWTVYRRFMYADIYRLLLC